MHSHHDYAVYALGDATAMFYGQDGKGMENHLPAGTFMLRGGENHSVKNTGKTPINVILVEVNRGMTPMTWDKTLDATKVAAAQYKLVKDTLGMRAITVNFKPGASCAMHAHPDVVLYVLEGSTAEFTDKAGKKTTAELKKGMVLIAPAEMHSVKNTGKTAMKGILVEVDRQ
jgi:quercetin dioxygenase-like cupin family protein